MFFLSCKANFRVNPPPPKRGTAHTFPNFCVVLCIVCVVLCIVCVYMCTVLLPPGGYPITVNKYIYYYRKRNDFQKMINDARCMY